MRWMALIMALVSCAPLAADDAELLNPDFWRREAIEHLGPLWLKNAPDAAHGGFHARLSRDWQPEPAGDKLPAMVSRQVYGMSVAFLLSGDDRYLSAARGGVDFLLKHGWDAQYGGWFDQLTHDGRPAETTKTVSRQLYTNVGLTMYGFATGDKPAMDHVRRSLQIRRRHAADPVYGGYAQQLDRQLSVVDWGKNKHAHYGYVGSLLLNLYLATGDLEVLTYARELADISLDKMRGPDDWFYGFHNKYDRQWQRTRTGGVEVASVGAQLTAALALLRLHDQSGDARYRDAGLGLGQRITQDGFDSQRGAWLDTITSQHPHHPVGETKIHWWHQIYGGLLQLHLHRLTGEDRYLANFQQTERLFVSAFRDPQHGGIYSAVDLQGQRVGPPHKAGPWRTSYHELEHALLNYLYLSLWVRHQPAVLHFQFDRSGEFFVSPVDDPEVRIASVTRNGMPWSDFDPQRRTVHLPAGRGQKLVVTLVK